MVQAGVGSFPGPRGGSARAPPSWRVVPVSLGPPGLCLPWRCLCAVVAKCPPGSPAVWGRTVTPPRCELGCTPRQPPALPVGLGVAALWPPCDGGPAPPLAGSQEGPSGTRSVCPHLPREELELGPLPPSLTVSPVVYLSQAEGPLVPVRVASMLEVRSWRNADLSLPHRCSDPGPSGASLEGPGGWLARHFRYGLGQAGGTGMLSAHGVAPACPLGLCTPSQLDGGGGACLPAGSSAPG